MSARFAILLPYYNESAYIADTVRSLLAQRRVPDQIVLVDNASTDGSEALCRTVIAEAGHPDTLFLREERPGKVNALETGLARIEADFVATCDADVLYPPHYLALAEELLRAHPDAAAVMAQYVETPPDESPRERRRLNANVRDARLFSSKCFTGGAGQIFRTAALRKAGGFSAAQWPYVLMDHEIMNRVNREGGSVYHEDLWLLHTDRRKDRCNVRWNLWERLVYRYTPRALGDWYFHRFLGPRLLKRKMTGLNLRHQPWSAGPDKSNAPG